MILFVLLLFVVGCSCGEPKAPEPAEQAVVELPATPTPERPVVGGGPMLPVGQGYEVDRMLAMESIYACDLDGDALDEILVCTMGKGVTAFKQAEDKSWAMVDNASMRESCQMLLCEEEGTAVLASGIGGGAPDADLVVRRIHLQGKELVAQELYGETSERTQATSLQWVDDKRGKRLMLARFVEQLGVSVRPIEGVEPSKNTEPVSMAMRHLWLDLNQDGYAEEIIGRLYGDEPRSDGGLRIQEGKKEQQVETLRGVRALAAWDENTALFGDGWHFKYREEGEARINALKSKGSKPQVEHIATLPGDSAIFEIEVRAGEKGPRALLLGDLHAYVLRREGESWLFEDLGSMNFGHRASLIRDRDGVGVLMAKDDILARLPLR